VAVSRGTVNSGEVGLAYNANLMNELHLPPTDNLQIFSISSFDISGDRVALQLH